MFRHLLLQNSHHFISHFVSAGFVDFQLDNWKIGAKIIQAILNLLDIILNIILLIEKFDHRHFPGKIKQLLNRYLNFIKIPTQFILFFQILLPEIIKDIVVNLEIILHFFLMLRESVENVDFLGEILVLQVNEFCLDVLSDLDNGDELVVVEALLGANLTHELMRHLIIKLNLHLPVLLANLPVGREYAELVVNLIKVFILQHNRHFHHK